MITCDWHSGRPLCCLITQCERQNNCSALSSISVILAQRSAPAQPISAPLTFHSHARIFEKLCLIVTVASNAVCCISVHLASKLLFNTKFYKNSSTLDSFHRSLPGFLLWTYSELSYTLNLMTLPLILGLLDSPMTKTPKASRGRGMGTV